MNSHNCGYLGPYQYGTTIIIATQSLSAVIHFFTLDPRPHGSPQVRLVLVCERKHIYQQPHLPPNTDAKPSNIPTMYSSAISSKPQSTRSINTPVSSRLMACSFCNLHLFQDLSCTSTSILRSCLQGTDTWLVLRPTP